MPIDWSEVATLSEEEMAERAAKDPAWFDEVLGGFAVMYQDDVQQNQLYYYQLANPDAMRVHLSTAREVAVVGGNRSTKTDSMLAELAIRMTNIIPESLRGIYPEEKLRGPIRARVVCNSLADTLEPIIKPKLRWDQWNGRGTPGDPSVGHWGWIPKDMLAGGKWEDAYHEKTRTLRVAVERKDGTYKAWSTCQFMSYDQDLSSHVGSSLHWVGHDELPPQDIYRESKIRTLDTEGQVYTAFTPPDEAGASRGDVSYFFDEVYEKGLPGPDKSPSVETIVLHTYKNRTLDPKAVAELESRLTAAQREVRLHGKFMHLSGVIFEEFSQVNRTWCFRCAKIVVPVDGTCVYCTGDDITEFCHVIAPFDIPRAWPIIFITDPHPRKPDQLLWAAVAPSDDIFLCAEGAVAGTTDDVADFIRDTERFRKFQVVERLMDPNIATQENAHVAPGWTLQRAYSDHGLQCRLADDNITIGVQRVREGLRPDRYTRKPTIHVFNDMPLTIKSMARWSWDEWSRSAGQDREPKERVRDRWKDACDCVRYLMNSQPTYSRLVMGAQVYRRPR